MSWSYGCERTGKRRYPSMEEAVEAVRRVARKGKPQRPYHCRYCAGYHLTHYLHETRPRSWHDRHHKKHR